MRRRAVDLATADRETGAAAKTPGRVVAVDAARGLAVLGMFAAHVGDPGPEPFRWPGGWLAIADGRSAALFALLAGVSISLMSGGPVVAAGEALERARVRVAIRAALVAVIGFVLAALGTPVQVILPAYALMFLLAVPLLAAPPRALATAACGFALLGPVAVAAAGGRASGFRYDPAGLLLTGYYPAVVWLAYLLAGMAVGRLDLSRRDLPPRLVLGGAALAAWAYGTGALTSAGTGPGTAAWFSVQPHADTTPEVLGNLGVALALLGLLLLLTRAHAARLALTPVAATGAMALTVYTGQLVAIAALGRDVALAPEGNGVLVAFVLVTLVAATVWTRLLGRGPLERLLRRASLGAAGLPAAQGRART